ncbi:MAG TPA: PQQ-binding-like beta-propeller repeat protein [Pirellulales bacterium]|nr:PQQ-binding-like beta-propeller repeat protein [Pirellulales bacterium]
MKALFALTLVASITSVGHAADDSLVWPRFRGPNGSGVAEGQKPPVEFGPDKNVKWKVAVPPGISSPIVAGDNLVVTAFDDGKLYTIAYRRADGQETWRTEAPATTIEGYHKVEGSPAASTPATDGRHIVSYFGSCGLFCYDLSGQELWRIEMPTVTTGGDFGSGVSPVIVDDTVILVRDEMKDPKIVAVDVATGSPRWEKARLSRASWCTPIVWQTAAGKQVVAPGHVQMVGYDLASGAELWTVTGLPSGCCSSPVAADGNLLFAGSSSGGADEGGPQMPNFDSLLKDLDKDEDGAISKAEGEQAFGGFFDNQDTNKDGKISREEFEAIVKFMSEGKNSAFALKPGGTGDVTTSHTIWKRTKGLPYIASAIAYGGRYIMVKDGGVVVACNAESGKQDYQERLGAAGRYYASPVAANGHVYFTSLENGGLTVLTVGGGKPTVAHSTELGERCAATPAIADNALYVRTADHLWAFAEKK